MDEAWERAVEAALEGQAADSPRTLTLDGAVKCLHGRLPPPELLERFRTLEHLSIANVGVSSLDKFPRLPNLQRLILSDNRISGGLEFLVAAGLESLRDLDLSNNRIQSLDDLAPLSSLRLVSLDLYECPVTRIRDYRSRVFALIRSLKYLDKMDADENEPPETDEDDDDDEEAEEEEEEDPGSGEIDGEDRAAKVANGVAGCSTVDGVVDADEDEESDADEEETVRSEANGSHHPRLANGFRVVPVREDDDDDDIDDEDFVVDEVGDDDDGGEDGEPVEEIDEEDGEDEDVVEVHDISDSDEEEEVDGFEVEEVDLEEEEDDDDEVDGDGDDEEEDVEDEDDDGEPGSTARMTSTDGEIDGHEQGEEDENGEIGEEEEEQGVEEEPDFEELDGDAEDEEEDDLDGDYLVQQHIPQAIVEEAGGSDLDACNGEDEDGVEDDDEDNGHHVLNNGPSSSSHLCNGEDEDGVDDDDEDLDAQPVENNGPSSSLQSSKRKRGECDAVADDDVEDLRSSKHP